MKFQEKRKRSTIKRKEKKINLSCVKWRSLLKFAEFSDLFLRGGKNKKSKKSDSVLNWFLESHKRASRIIVEEEEKC